MEFECLLIMGHMDAMLQWKQLVGQDLVVTLACNDLTCGGLLVVIGNHGQCRCYGGYIVQRKWAVDLIICPHYQIKIA